MPLSRFILLPPSPLHSRRTTTKNTPDLHPQTLSYGLHPQHFLTSKPPPSPFPTLFDQTPPPSSFQCNTLIRAHTQSHLPEAALLLFQKMLSDGRSPPDKFTFPLVLKACAQLSALDEGEQIHCMILKSQSVPADNVYVTTSLLRMYAQCGRTDEAQRLFDGMPNRNVVTWNTMIDGFVKSNDMNSARRLFDEMPDRNVVSWNSLMGGYVRNELPHEALKIFIELHISGVVPDESTMASVVSAISDLGLLSIGRRVHGYIIRQKISLEDALGTALINMYTKCGDIDGAYQVFLNIAEKNVGHWTSIIGGFAAHGLVEAALELFSEMLGLGVEPNHVTFIGVLSACSHGGLVNEGIEYFNLMRSWGIRPTVQHYGCLVDLLGRSGLLEEALELVGNTPMESGLVIWGTLLAACRNHGNIEIAEIVAQKLIEVEPEYGSSYVLLSNLYARMGRWEDFRRTRKMMEEMGVMKAPGFSWIEVDGGVQIFVAGDRFHVNRRAIYCMLDDLKLNLRWAGYEPVTCARPGD
ncbi:pentatricopeptide repeat-containing protein [Cocos nucifera]|uniref:Pentatricopeptide repeat-containing protein n=1 Tax=Cocos nucifera TaxID=13894 RepID=A0A8K0I2I4_COCNU|nr:pentatricopeptide repeat-containing protein [Cocos nucifera]